MKKHRDANERAKHGTKNELTNLNSHKETNHKDMIEWSISLINVRKNEKKKWITEKVLRLDLKIDSWLKSMNHEEGGRCPETIARKFTLS